MYKNVGKKIQTLAKVVVWFGIIVCVLVGGLSIYGGLNTNNVDMTAKGVLIFFVGPILCWLSSLTTVGFGKLIETNESMKEEIDSLHKTVEDIKNK